MSFVHDSSTSALLMCVLAPPYTSNTGLVGPNAGMDVLEYNYEICHLLSLAAYAVPGKEFNLVARNPKYSSP